MFHQGIYNQTSGEIYKVLINLLSRENVEQFRPGRKKRHIKVSKINQYTNRYSRPHQSKREKARRIRQRELGILTF